MLQRIGTGADETALSAAKSHDVGAGVFSARSCGAGPNFRTSRNSSSSRKRNAMAAGIRQVCWNGKERQHLRVPKRKLRHNTRTKPWRRRS